MEEETEEEVVGEGKNQIILLSFDDDGDNKFVGPHREFHTSFFMDAL